MIFFFCFTIRFSNAAPTQRLATVICNCLWVGHRRRRRRHMLLRLSVFAPIVFQDATPSAGLTCVTLIGKSEIPNPTAAARGIYAVSPMSPPFFHLTTQTL